MKHIFRFAVCAVLCMTLLTANLCMPSAASGFWSKAEMVHIESHLEGDVGLGAYSPVQGACTDGKYAYFVFVSGGVSTISKYDINTWEYVRKEQFINMGHSNDMTYNSDKGYIVVANNAPYYDVVTLIDPDTLAPIKDVQLKEDIYSIAYNAKRKCYVVGLSGGYDFALLDSDFKVTKKFTGVKTGYTRQGCDCDDDYIYFVQSGGNNVLVVYDYSGNLVTQIPLASSDEVENLFHVGSVYYTSLYYYGVKLYRLGFSDSTKITYTVSYDPNGGEGEMEPTKVHYGEDTPLRANAFTRDGYFFAGWQVERTADNMVAGYRNGASDFEWLSRDEVFDYRLYADEDTVSTTVRYGGVKLYASWIADEYDIEINSGDGEGESLSFTQPYSEDFTVPDGGYTMEGYIFDGYTATRECDGRTYGFRKDSDTAEWLYESDVDKPYVFQPDDTFRCMTPEGKVTLTAQYKFAYTFGEDGSTLVEYVGVDEKVNIPDNKGELKTLAQGAIKDNEIMTDLYIPAGVDSLEKEAVTNCPKLRGVYFEGSLPAQIDGESIVSDESPVIYETHNGEKFWVGFFAGEAGIPLLRFQSDGLKAFLESIETE